MSQPPETTSNETNAGADEALGEHRALADASVAVALHLLVVVLLLGEVESLEVFALHELEGLFVELGVGLHLVGLELATRKASSKVFVGRDACRDLGRRHRRDARFARPCPDHRSGAEQERDRRNRRPGAHRHRR